MVAYYIYSLDNSALAFSFLGFYSFQIPHGMLLSASIQLGKRSYVSSLGSIRSTSKAIPL